MNLAAFGLLTDENIDPAVVAFLRVEGFDVLDVKEQNLIGGADVDLLRLAFAQNRVVVTHDSDFGTLAVAASEPMTGIVYLRPGHIKPEFTVGTLRVLTVGTLRVLLAQNVTFSPPFIVVATRTGTQIKIRVRHMS